MLRSFLSCSKDSDCAGSDGYNFPHQTLSLSWVKCLGTCSVLGVAILLSENLTLWARKNIHLTITWSIQDWRVPVWNWCCLNCTHPLSSNKNAFSGQSNHPIIVTLATGIRLWKHHIEYWHSADAEQMCNITRTSCADHLLCNHTLKQMHSQQEVPSPQTAD